MEKSQIENDLGLMSHVSLTDHDNLEAALLLRVMPETRDIPISLEWSVPFEGAVFHLGVHNLPSARALAIVADLAGYTREPSDQLLIELLAALNACPEVLIVFNHPMWNQYGLDQARYRHLVDLFLHRTANFLHAFELNGTRSWKENESSKQLAGRWQRVLVAGGDRHGRQPSCALNLTQAESFPEFVSEVRVEERSHLLFMRPYAEPSKIRMAQEVVDVIRDYPEFPEGSRRWDDRIFHPDWATDTYRPLSSFWKTPPAFIEYAISAIRMLDNAMVRKALKHVMKHEGGQPRASDATDEAMV